MATYVDWDPNGVRIKDLSALPKGAGRAVAEVSEIVGKDSHTVRFKLHDKLGALNSLAKHLGMFLDRQEINVNTHWRFTIGKGYDEADADASRVVNGHMVDEIPQDMLQ